jgi:alkyl sulfatase BDS1-like metallo-beta-lactamase superfamily hydrolase
MLRCFTQEWLDETQKRMSEGLPEWPGVSARMQYIVVGAPEGDIGYYWVLEDGKLVECKLGQLDDADVTMKTQYQDAVEIQRGTLDASSAFMQGKVKVTGNMAKVMALLPMTSSSEYKHALAEIAAVTEF